MSAKYSNQNKLGVDEGGLEPFISPDSKETKKKIRIVPSGCQENVGSQKTAGKKMREGKLSEWKRKAERAAIETCTVHLLRRRLPIITWLPRYNVTSGLYDMIAGVTVGLTCIPQSIAYAAIAGLPLQYGLYSSFMGFFAYTIFGTVKEASIGPTAVLSLMTFRFVFEGGPTYAALLAFLTGLIELLAGILNLGFVVEFISTPVISGFCSAAALTVASTQVKGLFGLKYKGSSFLEIWKGFFSNLTEIHPWDALLGCSVIVLLLLIRKLTSLKNLRPLKDNKCLHNRYVDGLLWFITTSRNALAVIIGCLAAYLLEQNGNVPFTLTGEIQAGLPDFTLPSFSINKTIGNDTVQLGFSEVISELGASLGLIPMIAILEHVAIAKAFSTGKRLDATQEMIALGMGNVMGSFFGSMPITASFGRSSVQSASGVKTPFANVYGGVLVILAMYFLMPSLAYIPKAILAAVIISSVIFMVEVGVVVALWKSRKIELIPFSITFFCCLLVNMEYGILIGAGIHLLMLAYMSNRPHPQVVQLPADEEMGRGRVLLKAEGSLYYPGVEQFRQALKLAKEDIRCETHKNTHCPCLIVDLDHVHEIDFTALRMLKSVAFETYNNDKSVLYIANANKTVAKAISSMITSEVIAFVEVEDD